MKVFTSYGRIVVRAEYLRYYDYARLENVKEHRFYDIHNEYIVVTENDAYDFAQFLLLYNLSAEDYKSKCVYEWEKTQKQQPRWKRMLAWCITNISRTLG